MGYKLYVGNLSFNLNENDLVTLFSEFGAIDTVKIIRETFDSRSKGFGFVTMNDDGEANKAIEAMNGHEMEGRPLRVNEARPKEDSPSEGSDW